MERRSLHRSSRPGNGLTRRTITSFTSSKTRRVTNVPPTSSTGDCVRSGLSGQCRVDSRAYLYSVQIVNRCMYKCARTSNSLLCFIFVRSCFFLANITAKATVPDVVVFKNSPDLLEREDVCKCDACSWIHVVRGQSCNRAPLPRTC